MDRSTAEHFRANAKLSRMACVSWGLVVLLGCAGEYDSRMGKTLNALRNPAPVTGALDGVFITWSSGDKDKAAKSLISIPWSDPTLIAGSAILSMSEQQFAAQAQAEKTQTQKQAADLASASKQLATHAISLGDTALASGDKPGAKGYYEAVLHLGETLSKPERLKVLQLTGDAVVKMANEKIPTAN